MKSGRVLVCAGSDSGGGAGIQGDIKTIAALGGFAATAVTALTAQNTLGVQGVVGVAPDFIRLQIRSVLEDIGADAIKTGMLAAEAAFEAVLAGRQHDELSAYPAAFEAMAEHMEALVLDTRDAESFANGHIPGSINIGLDGQFAPWVGALISDIQQNILVVAAEGREEESIKRLARVGYDRVLGFLEGGFAAWQSEKRDFDTVKRINADELAAVCSSNPTATVLDVRKTSENYSERLPSAINLPLDDLNVRFNELPEADTLYIHCAGGYRSMIFASILKSRGVHNLVDVRGGFGAIKNAGLQEVTAYVCPSTML